MKNNPKPSIPDELKRALILHQQGQFAESLPLYQRQLALTPNQWFIWAAKGEAHLYLGQIAEFTESFQKAIALAKDIPDPTLRYAIFAFSLGHYDDVKAVLSNAIKRFPDHIPTLSLYGCFLNDMEKQDPVRLELYEKVKANNDGKVTSYLFLGGCGLNSLDFAEAKHYFSEAYKLEPTNDQAVSNLAVALSELGEMEEAVTLMDKTIASRDVQPGFIKNYIKFLHDQRWLEKELELIDYFTKKFPLHPQLWEILSHRANVSYLQGDFLSRHYYFEYRKHQPLYGHDSYVDWARSGPLPAWGKGEDLTGRHLALILDGGFGDNIQMFRYLPLLFQKGVAKITLSLGVHQTALMPLLKANLSNPQSHPPIEVAELFSNRPGKADCHESMLSLSWHFDTVEASIPPVIPEHWQAPVTHKKLWTERLESYFGKSLRQKPLIGLNFGGNPNHPEDKWRELRLPEILTLLYPILTSGKANFVLIQKVFTKEDRQFLRESSLPLYNAGPMIVDFCDTAALLEEVAMLLTLDSAPAHLAASKLIPVWMVMAHRSDPRWLVGRKDTGWYPTMRLYHQDKLYDWRGIMHQIIQDFHQALPS